MITVKIDLELLGRRVREARTANHMSQQALGDAIGASKQLISAWESGRAELTASRALRVSSVLGTSIDWLLGANATHDGRQRDLGLTEGIPSAVSEGACPKLERSDIALLADRRLSLKDKQGWRRPFGDCSAKSFAVAVFDKAMVPAFEPGDILVIDTLAVPESGDCIVVVLMASGTVLFRRYKSEPSAEGGKGLYTLLADNPTYDPRIIHAGDKPEIVGTLAEHIKFGPR